MRYFFMVSDLLGDSCLDMVLFNAIASLDKSSYVVVYARTSVCPELLEGNPNVAEIYIRPKKTYERLALQASLIMQKWDVILRSDNLDDPAKNRLFYTLMRGKHKRFFDLMPTKDNHILTRMSMLQGILPIEKHHIDVTIRSKPLCDRKVFEKINFEHGKRIITISPGASVPKKHWSKDKYIELINYLQDDYDEIMILGSANEMELCSYVAKMSNSRNLAGKLKIMEVCALMSNSSLHIGNDSGLGHVAAAVGTKCISIGSQFPDYRFRPWGQHQILGNVHEIGLADVIAMINQI